MNNKDYTEELAKVGKLEEELHILAVSFGGADSESTAEGELKWIAGAMRMAHDDAEGEGFTLSEQQAV
jgi:hypothetical protein